MTDFKIVFPSGYNEYNVPNILDANIDLNVSLPNSEVFFATFFTLQNIKNLMEKDNSLHFWSTNMVIVKDLSKETIKNCVAEIIEANSLNSVFCKIGTISEVYCEQNIQNFDDLESDV